MLLSRVYISHQSWAITGQYNTAYVIWAIYCECEYGEFDDNILCMFRGIGRVTIHNFVTISSQQYTNLSFPNNFVTMHNILL